MQKQHIKEQFHKLIEEIEDEALLQMLYDDAVEYTTKNDEDEDLTPEQIASIELGLKQIEEGKVYTHEEVMQHIKEWRNLE